MTTDDVKSPDEGQNTQESYRLEVDEVTGYLMGVVQEPSACVVTLHELDQKILVEDYKLFYFPVNSREQFLRKLQKAEVGSYVIGERRNAKIKITIPADKKSARVQTSKAFGGTPLSVDMIQLEIKNAKLDSRCIDKEKLAQLFKSTSEVDLILAKSTPVENGSDATLTPLITSAIAVQKDSDSAATIDQHEIFEFLVVEPGRPLMKKTPASQGRNGLDVTGGVLKAIPGKNISFVKPFSGVTVSTDDENILIASIKGHPVVFNNTVKVDPVMVLEAVDIHSGNVDYDGSLVISNDIESGYTVNVTGDILVKGSIYKSTINSGGTITVNGGVHADNIDNEYGCYLNAEGDIRAKFINHSNVHSHGSIHISEYIMQSRVTAKGELNAGKERGKGCIIGGYCCSETGVNAKVLGSDAYVATSISLGSESELSRDIIKLGKVLERRCGEEQQLSLILKKVRSHGEPTKVGRVTLDKARKIENTVLLLQQRISELREQLSKLRLQDHLSDHLQVSVSGRIYPNVQVRINGRVWACESMRNKVVITQSDDILIVEPLK